MISKMLLLSLLLGPAIACIRSQEVIPLWRSKVPLGHGQGSGDRPEMTVYLPKAQAGRPSPLLVIFPGGGYVALSMDFEGYNLASWFQQRGVAVAVVRYRLASDGYHHPAPLLDAQRSVRLVRSLAAEWNVDLLRIGVMGFSAGGHLASTLETHFDRGNPHASDPVERVSCRPDFSVLVYAVINADPKFRNPTIPTLIGPKGDPKLLSDLSNDTRVTPETPPTLFVYTADDPVVDPQNSKLMYAALRKAGVPTAIQEYPTGGHGFGLGKIPDHGPAGWLDRVRDWMESGGFAPSLRR